MKNITEENFVVEYTWQELYVLTKHWKSDIQFYKDDLKFLQKLINKYIIWITKEENLAKVTKTQNELNNVVEQCDTLITNIEHHIKHLADLINNPFKYDSQEFKEEHTKLEIEIYEFIKTFRKSKTKAFAITEYVVDDEKLTNYLK